MIVSHEKKDIIRSHHDLEKDTCRYTKKAARVTTKMEVVLKQKANLPHLSLSLSLSL